MVRFIFCFLAVLYIAQECALSSVDDGQAQAVTEISEFLTEMTTGIKKVMEEVSSRLPRVISQLEYNFKQNVNELNTDNLSEQTREAIADCISKSRVQAEDVKHQLQELQTKSSKFGSDATGYIEQCMQESTDDMAVLANCLKQQSAHIKEAVNGIGAEIENTLSMTETVVASISNNLDDCLQQAQFSILDDETDVHTDEL